MHVILYGPNLPLSLTTDERNALISVCKFYLVDYIDTNNDVSICFNCYKKYDNDPVCFCVKCGKEKRIIGRSDYNILDDSKDDVSSLGCNKIEDTLLKCRTNVYVGKLNNRWQCDHTMVITCRHCIEIVQRKYIYKNMASIL